MQNSAFLPRALGALGLALAIGAAQAQNTDTTTTTATPASAATAPTQPNVSSDRNVPPATAHKQAAEIARGDPARWSRPDIDSAARLKTLRKETAAALQESLGNCRTQPQADRAACVKQARDTYQQEMAGLKDRLASGQ